MKYAEIVVTLAACLLLVAGICKKAPPERQWQRGYFEPIGGRPFALATGLEVAHMYGADDAIPSSELPLDLLMRNITSKRINASFPAGLVFKPAGPDHEDYQYMMILQSFVLSVPANSETTLFVPTYCCNEELDEPDEDESYQFSIQVDERELNELIDLVRGKRLEGDTAVTLAQDALFEITDGNGLTDSTRTKLQNLP